MLTIGIRATELEFRNLPSDIIEKFKKEYEYKFVKGKNDYYYLGISVSELYYVLYQLARDYDIELV